MTGKAEKIEVTERATDVDPRRAERHTELAHSLFGARMHGKDDRQLRTDALNRVDDGAERATIVDVARAMERRHRVGALGQVETCCDSIENGLMPVGNQRIDHDVADEVDTLGRHALARQILVRIDRRRQQDV